MRRLVFLTVILILSISCSNKTDDGVKLVNVDFGKGQYEEPFVFLSSKPRILVKSLEYTPNFFLSDTIVLEKTFSIGFNEESIRSKSTAFVQLVDSTGFSPKGISVYFNDSLSSNGWYEIKPSLQEQDLKIKLKLDPDRGEHIFYGNVIIKADELDLINELNVQEENIVIGEWKVKQEISWPILLWIIWFIIVSFILVFLGILIKFIFEIFIWLGSVLNTSIASSSELKVVPNADRPYKRVEIDAVFKKTKTKLHAEAVIRGKGEALFQDCYTGKVLRGGDLYDYEHIRSSEEIYMKYRDILTNEEIAEVVNCEENVKVTLRSINQSKGKRRFEEWASQSIIMKHNICIKTSKENTKIADIGIKKAIKNLNR
ncbi:hypothetical protein [Myroides guanonis]|uniref:Uncharacterized protein n=1 Tax=Myroides guanonis TaxID=1150112 RepID=A0A1I3LKX2_9FLAO|nr:hypothetical protein [Myroides guanonis]SFI85347.1 hypothetical protein SAMN04487893_101377 [Myroides guanonis]